MSDQHRTVSRLVGILEYVAGRSDGATLTEIAGQLDAARSTIYGFLRGLVYEGYLDESDEGRYVFGRGAHLMLLQKSEPLLHIVEPVLEDINERFNETVTLAVHVGKSLSYIASRQSTQRIVYLPTMYSRRPLWPTSAGKIFLAAMSQGEIEQIIDDTESNAVHRELAEVRRTGFALNRGETVADVSAIAIGIGHEGDVTASITVGGPQARIEPVINDLVDYMRAAVTNAGLQVWSFEEQDEPSGRAPAD